MSIAAGILAGGESRRFGSDKAWALLDGKPLIAHLIESLRPQVDAILLSVREISPAYHALQLPLIVDQLGCGPLAGVAALLGACRQEWLLLVPCDAVRVPADWVVRMLQTAAANQAMLVVRKEDERVHPTFALLHSSLRDDLQMALHNGERALFRWQQRISASAWLSAEAPMNINTVSQLHRIQSDPLVAAQS